MDTVNGDEMASHMEPFRSMVLPNIVPSCKRQTKLEEPEGYGKGCTWFGGYIRYVQGR